MFRTICVPLSTLRLGLEAVLDGVVEGRKAQQYLKRACCEIDYLARLVEQLLLLAKADAGQHVLTSLSLRWRSPKNASSGCSRLLLKQA